MPTARDGNAALLLDYTTLHDQYLILVHLPISVVRVVVEDGIPHHGVYPLVLI
jgi:hypothetical protein